MSQLVKVSISRIKTNVLITNDEDRSQVCEKLHLKGLSHEIDFKNFDKNLQNLA
jgi:hypothetical protein